MLMHGEIVFSKKTDNMMRKKEIINSPGKISSAAYPILCLSSFTSEICYLVLLCDRDVSINLKIINNNDKVRGNVYNELCLLVISNHLLANQFNPESKYTISLCKTGDFF